MIAFCLFTTFQDMYFSFNLISTFSSVSVNFSVLKGFALPSLIWNLVLNNICSNHSFRLLYVLLNLWHIFTHKHTYVVWTVLISKSIHLWSYKRLSGKEPICQCRRHRKCGFDLWVRKIPWRRKWQSTPVFLPRLSRGQRSLSGYNPWDCKRVGHDLETKQQQHVHVSRGT